MAPGSSWSATLKLPGDRRQVGGPRGLMARVADLYRLYDEENARFGRDPSQTSMHFKNVYGTCGGCELLATALFEADTVAEASRKDAMSVRPSSSESTFFFRLRP